MQTFTTIIAASAFVAAVSGSPLTVRNTCGSAPSSGGSQAPISQPTGIATAAACQAQCEANGSCQSFVFGLVDGTAKCMLYSVPAASVPKQSSTALVAYDKACTSVPTTAPATSNAPAHKLAVRATCGSAPTGTGSSAPLSTPAGITTAEACQAQCEANGSCQSFVFGMVDNVVKCMLYSVPAASVPKQSSTNLIAYDKACTSVPAVVPTSSNPTGVATSTSGSNTGSNAGSNTGSNTGTNTGSNTGSTSGSGTNTNTPSGQHKRNTCGATPSGPTGQAAPISTPANINSVADCRAACQADASCKSFEFGTMTSGGAQTCRLFSVAASSVPAPAKGQTFVVYDSACSI
ncbi:hypothetical protein BKA64DRAFT_741542 [Cadophora sp. MPI-SDFR-AT-0126]|nr:hypothetical protein BKA64DRAFT_741542 [Leotiomycetes sp. MPI-SDFR-AT-0126]